MSALKRLGLDHLISKSNKLYTTTQDQTKNAFSFKWAKRDSYESTTMQNFSRQWLLERYCGDNPESLCHWLSGGRKIIMDVGCGSGYSALLLFGELLKEHDYLGVDISDAVEVARQRFHERGYWGDFLQMDLFDLPLPRESVDLIFAEGVLHHTGDTKKAIEFLATILKKGGRFLFYVYAKKGPIREFTDDYIRQCLASLNNEDAWRALEPLTKLGITLGKMQVKLEVPEDIPFLQIPKGEIDLQRFFYWHICKLFYRPEFSLEEMQHINFDWYRPLNCQRHTPEEIIKWCEDASLIIEHIKVEASGITVVAIR